MQPKISVIVPVYNVEEYLPQCLESLTNQTLKDIEIICVNDGSTDNCLEILQAFAKQDNRITIIDKKNEGVSAARNAGLNIAKGEYVTFVDSDDFLELDACQLIYAEAIKNGADLTIFELNLTDNVGKKRNANTLKEFTENVSFVFSECPNKFFYILTGIGGKLYKKTSDLFCNTMQIGEDTVYLWTYCLLHNPVISIYKTPLYNYRQHSNSIMHTSNFTYLLFDTIRQFVSTDVFTRASSNVKALILDRFALSIWWNFNISAQKQQKMSKLYIQHTKTFIKLFDAYDCLDDLRYLPKLRKKMRLVNCCVFSYLRKILSVTNTKDKKHKIINIFGFKIKIKKRSNQEKKERRLIAKIKHNQKKYPKDSYLLFDCLNGDISECIDAYSLFRYMRGVGKKAYYVIMEEHPLYKQLEKENNLEGIIALEKSMKDNPGDFLERVYEILLSSKAIITAFDVYSNQTRTFILKNKYWKYIFIQHGPTFLKETVLQNGYISENKWDRILISSEYEKRVLKKYGWQDEKMIKIGLPRWDLLQAPLSSTERSIFVMFTWRRFGREEFDHSLYKENLLKMLYNEKLHNYLKQHNIKVYFAPHHSLMGLRGISFSPSTENVICVNSNECSKYIRKCSMLITDYSSVTFDFMFQNKPVILYLLDKNDKNLNKWDREDLRHFEYKKYLIPNVIFDESKLIEKIKYYVEHNFQLEPDVQYKYDSFFYTKDHICQRLTREIDSACENNLKQ